jgi:hypothetical protein
VFHIFNYKPNLLFNIRFDQPTSRGNIPTTDPGPPNNCLSHQQFKKLLHQIQTLASFNKDKSYVLNLISILHTMLGSVAPSYKMVAHFMTWLCYVLFEAVHGCGNALLCTPYQCKTNLVFSFQFRM